MAISTLASCKSKRWRAADTVVHVIVIGDRPDPSFPGPRSSRHRVPDVYLRPNIKHLVVGDVLQIRLRQDVYHP